MNTIDLVDAIRQKMYLNSMNRYRDLLNRNYDKNIINEYIKAIVFFQSLSDNDKKHVLFLIETVIDDTISNFFAWLDGAYYLSNQDKEVELKIGEKKMNIDGYLSDIWKNLQDGVQREDLNGIYNDSSKK